MKERSREGLIWDGAIGAGQRASLEAFDAAAERLELEAEGLLEPEPWCPRCKRRRCRCDRPPPGYARP